jgi:hypothetical protein
MLGQRAAARSEGADEPTDARSISVMGALGARIHVFPDRSA